MEPCAHGVGRRDVEGSAPRDAGARMIVTPEAFTARSAAARWNGGPWPTPRRCWHGGLRGNRFACAWPRSRPMLRRAGRTADRNFRSRPCLPWPQSWHAAERSRQLFATESPLASRSRCTATSTAEPCRSGDLMSRFRRDAAALYLFGAGHVGRALVLALGASALRDPLDRSAARRLSVRLRRRMCEPCHRRHPVTELTRAPAGSFVLVMTHSHALDLAMVDARVAR